MEVLEVCKTRTKRILIRISLRCFCLKRDQKISQACLFLNQSLYFRVQEHVILVIEDYEINPEELLLKILISDVLLEAKLEKKS